MKLNDMMYFKKDRFNKLMVLCDYTDPNEGIVLPEPFQNLSIKDMIELDKRVSVHEINHGHSSELIVNEEIASDKNSIYVSLLYYVKYLVQEMEEYYGMFQQMTRLGFDFPDIYTYLKKLIETIKTFVLENQKNAKRTFPIDVINHLGQDHSKIDEQDHELYEVIDIMIKEDQIEDLPLKANQLLKILEVPEEELAIRQQTAYEHFGREEFSLDSFIQESSKEDNPQYQK